MKKNKNFRNWQDYRARAELEDCYTKSHLRELGLRPRKNAILEYRKVYTAGRWVSFEFYTIKDTEPIRKRNKTQVIELEINPENLCKSLYLINKSAKKSRDTKVDNYKINNHGVVRRAKTRQNNLYELKNKSMQYMINEGILRPRGYHMQTISGYTDKQYLLMYSYSEYKFHEVYQGTEEPQDIKYLGKIDHSISAEVHFDFDIKFSDAVALLKKYIAYIERLD